MFKSHFKRSTAQPLTECYTLHKYTIKQMNTQSFWLPISPVQFSDTAKSQQHAFLVCFFSHFQPQL